MSNKFFDQVGGIISVSIPGKRQERIINLAISRGIYIWDIKRKDNELLFKVRNSALEALQNLTEEYGYELKIVNKSGLPFYKKLLSRRGGFLGGAIIFVLTLYLMSSFVWFTNVSGNNTVEKSRILLSAARNGVYKGAPKWSFSRSTVEEEILKDISELSYVQLDINGVKVNINVVEKILPGTEISGPCHVVAGREAVIYDVLVLEGQQNVKVGDVVAKGDILISGIVFPEDNNTIEISNENLVPYTVRARGIVKGETWYEGYGECNLQAKKKVLTGREMTKIYLETPAKSILLKGSRDSSFKLSIQESKRTVFHLPFGDWAVYKLHIKEQEIEKIEKDEEEALNIAREKAMESLKKQIKKSNCIGDVHFNILSQASDSIIRVKAAVVIIEDISLVQPINGTEVRN